MERSKTLSKKLISLVLSLLMVFSCFSGMGLTAFAAPTCPNPSCGSTNVEPFGNIENEWECQDCGYIFGASFGGDEDDVSFTKVTSADEITAENIGTCAAEDAKSWAIANWDDLLVDSFFAEIAFYSRTGELNYVQVYSGLDEESLTQYFDNLTGTASISDLQGWFGNGHSVFICTPAAPAEDGPLVGTVIKVGDTLTLDGDYIEVMPGVIDQATDSFKLERMEYDNYFNGWGAVFEESYAFLIAGDETPEPDGFYVSGGNGTQSHPYTLALHYASAAPVTEWHIGDPINLGGKYYINDDQGAPSSYGFDRDVIVSEPVYETMYNQWIFENVIASNASEAYALYISLPTGKTASDVPTGFKVKSGDGTEASPYEFELVYAAAATAYAGLKNTTTVVHFDSKDWYLIEDNSTSATEGTVTLLAKECVGASTFGDNNTYSGSTVETYINNWYADNISADAKVAVSGGAMFLLTTAQATTIEEANSEVLKCDWYEGTYESGWWLCSPVDNGNKAAYVNGESGYVNVDGSYVDFEYGVRPALKLDLSKVEFDSETKTFALPAAGAATAITTLEVGKVYPSGTNFNFDDYIYLDGPLGGDAKRTKGSGTISYDYSIYDDTASYIRVSVTNLEYYSSYFGSWKPTTFDVQKDQTISSSEYTMFKVVSGSGTENDPFVIDSYRVPDPVPYMAWDETDKTVKDVEGGCTDYTVVTNTTTAFEDGKWYVVNGEVSVASRITVTGTANLILCDGAKLNANEGIALTSGKTLNIYGQSNGTGELTARGGEKIAGIGGGNKEHAGNVTINGGVVYATGGNNGAGIGGGNEGNGGNVTINGGKVYATGGTNGAGIGGGDYANGGIVTVNGGTVDAKTIGNTSATSIGNGRYKSNAGSLIVASTHVAYSSNSPITDENKTSATAVQGSGAAMNIARQHYMLVEEGNLHTHDFSYAAGYNAIIAECTADGCPLDDGTEQHNHIITLNIVAPTLTTYGQTGEGISAEATLDGLDAFNAATGLNVSATDIKYYEAEELIPGYTRPGEELDGAPTNAGSYFAGITISDVKISETVTTDVSAYVSYTIAKADPIANAPTGLTATFGQTLADVTITNPSGNTAGTWAWMNDTASVGNVVTPAASFKANFIPTDTANYNTVLNVDVTVTVGKANPTYTVPTGLEATYGDTLSSVTLPTGWSWVNGSQKVGNAETKTFKATYTPADTTNYNVVNNIDVTVTVNKADINPTVSITGWTYGQAANSPSVSGNTGDGHVKYTYAVKGSDEFSETVPTDANTYTVKAAIAATTNYNGKTVTADFTIAKATPNLIAPKPSATYGDTLADATMTNHEQNVPGTWAWVDDTQSVGNAGENTFKATFTPDDTTNYNVVENVDVTLNVDKAAINPTVTLEGWTYGETANTPVVDGNTGEGAVTYTYATKNSDSFSDAVPTDAGEYTVKASIAATDNYKAGTATADFMVAKADIAPTVSIEGWTYGDKANKPSIDGNTGKGVVTYLYKEKGASDMSCIEEAPTQAGEYTVKAIIGETDNYNAGSATADFTIAKAKVTITANDKSSKREADLKKLSCTVEGEIFEGDDLGIKVSSNVKAAVAGKYAIKVTFTENANYDVKVVNGTYTVIDRITANERTKGKNKINSAIKATVNKNGSITAKWGAVANAEKFEIYATYCDGGSYKMIKSVDGNVHSFNITKINKKALNQKKSVKLYVVAYRKVNGKYEKITQSINLHVAGAKAKKSTNAKAITVKKDKFTIKVNKTATIKPTLVLQNSKKKGVEHVAKFRYQSTNTAVATVDANGKITAVGKGTCTIYIFANNGKLKSVKVTVK